MRLSITVRPTDTPKVIRIVQPKIQVTTRPQRVLDFDIENRPLSYLGSDFTTGEVTAISWAWADRPNDVTVYLLGESELPDILDAFVEAYNQADLVIGHFIRGHDLPMVNGALMEFRKRPLSDKRTQDTKLDCMRTKGISLSQESLSAMLRLDHSKVQMNQHKWRAANRLTPEGLAWVRERVTGDVTQHIEMWNELRRLGYLSAPKSWHSHSSQPLAAYSA